MNEQTSIEPDFDGFAIVETWKDISGFKGLYEVSSLGRVRREGRVLKPQNVSGGYLKVELWQIGECCSALVHRLVAESFLGPRPTGHEVDHIDGNKRNNAFSNLEYVTRSENMQRAYALGLRSATISAARAARRKPRKLVQCRCGCGTLIETPSHYGRDKTFYTGHGKRKSPGKEVIDWFADVILSDDRRLFGRVWEDVIDGSAIGKIDVIDKDGRITNTQSFNGREVLRIIPCTTDTAREMARSASQIGPDTSWKLRETIRKEFEARYDERLKQIEHRPDDDEEVELDDEIPV